MAWLWFLWFERRPVSLWALCILTHSSVVKFTERLCLQSESPHSTLVRSYPSLPQRTGHGWHQRQRVTSEKLCSRVQTHCSNFTALLKLLPNLSECSKNVMKKVRHVCSRQIFQLQTSGDNFIGAVCFSPTLPGLSSSVSLPPSPYLPLRISLPFTLSHSAALSLAVFPTKSIISNRFRTLIECRRHFSTGCKRRVLITENVFLLFCTVEPSSGPLARAKRSVC